MQFFQDRKEQYLRQYLIILQASRYLQQYASNDFKGVIQNVAKAAGVDMLKLATITGDLTLSTTDLKNVLLSLVDTNDKYLAKVSGEGGSLSAAKDLATEYANQYTEVKNVNTAMTTYLANLENLKTKAKEAMEATNGLTESIKNQSNAGNPSGGGTSGVGNAGGTNATVQASSNTGGGGGGAPKEEPKPQLQDNPGAVFDDINSGRAGNGAARSTYLSARYTASAISRGQAAINEAYANNWTRAQVRAKYGFDTGGYTGEWGSEGKLALLHEKEIVLNKADTKNLLDIVSMVREMTGSSLLGANGMMSGMMEALASITNNSTSNNQTVQITAEFPNVRVASEIEEAFNNLTNIASQHAFQY